MKKNFLFLLVLFFSLSVFAQDNAPLKTASDRQAYVQQQMVLMGLYVYGIKQELAKKVPNYDELEFLSDSLLSITKELKNTKHDILFHKNLIIMLKTVEDLKAASQNDHAKASIKAKAVVNACGSCHTTGLSNISDPIAVKPTKAL